MRRAVRDRRRHGGRAVSLPRLWQALLPSVLRKGAQRPLWRLPGACWRGSRRGTPPQPHAGNACEQARRQACVVRANDPHALASLRPLIGGAASRRCCAAWTCASAQSEAADVCGRLARPSHAPPLFAQLSCAVLRQSGRERMVRQARLLYVATVFVAVRRCTSLYVAHAPGFAMHTGSAATTWYGWAPRCNASACD